MKRFGFFAPALVVTAAALALVACGDDDDTSPVDAGMVTDGSLGMDAGANRCPAKAPMREQMMAPCCYRASNAARLDAPELRLSAIRITKPSSLSSAIISGLLASALDEERFNWLIQISNASAALMIKTGYGERNADGTFGFTMGAAPLLDGGTGADRWDPLTLPGMLTGETLSAPPYAGTFTLPIFAEDGSISIELPIQGLQLTSAALSENRTCVGNRSATSYDTSMATLQAYLTVEASSQGSIAIGSDLRQQLCMVIAGMIARTDGNCQTIPQSEWPSKPDSLCDTAGCMTNPEGMTTVCDPTSTCNAWKLDAQFAAHGVEIAD